MLAKSYGRKQNLMSTKYQPTNSDFRAIVRTTQQVIGNRAVVPTGNIIMISALDLYVCLHLLSHIRVAKKLLVVSIHVGHDMDLFLTLEP